MRPDYRAIAGYIEPGSKVLDLGCGSGELMQYLQDKKNIKAQGIELDEDKIYKCVALGLSVFHSDIDNGLKGYPDKTFDYVVLNQCLQEVTKIDYVIDESLRVAHKVIIGFPNFAHITSRFMLFFLGRSPLTKSLPFNWNDTPNKRFLSIRDFEDYCKTRGLKISSKTFLSTRGRVRLLPNLFASNAIFVISK